MKERSKTLIIFSPAFPKNEQDTIWLPWLQIFVKSLNKNFPNLKVVLFAFQYPHSTKQYQWNGNLVIPFNGLHKKKLQRALMWLKILLQVRKFKQNSEVLGIFSMWCGECTLLAKHAANFFKLKYFCWIVGQDARETNTYVKRIQPKAASLVVMSDFLADEFFKNHHLKPEHIITNGIDISMFDKMPETKDIDIIGVGSLSFLKQYDVFVEVISMLKINFTNIQAVIYGNGEAREKIEQQIIDLSLQENIKLLGTLPHNEVLKQMQRSKILLHPSSYEGFSGVCLEALYAGAHVISFVQPMHHEIKNWHIVKTKEQMHDKVLELLMAEIKHESVLAYSMNDSAKAVMKLFDYT